jgi:hypothetical protein
MPAPRNYQARNSRAVFVHEVLDLDSIQRSPVAELAYAVRGKASFFAVKRRRGRDELGDGDATLGDRDLSAAGNLAQELAQPVLCFGSGVVHGGLAIWLCGKGIGLAGGLSSDLRHKQACGLGTVHRHPA